jgi:23S rRNA (uracil1939-C5)-methyltransferase
MMVPAWLFFMFLGSISEWTGSDCSVTAFTVLPTSQTFRNPPRSVLEASTSRKKTGGKWDQRRGKKPKSNNSGIRRRGSPEEVPTRPVLTVYSENRNENINQQRLESAIGCEHFGTCPGCVVEENVGDVEIVESAKRYFSSTAVRRKRQDVIDSGEDWVIEDTDDGFYKVIIPSDIIQWRTQAKLVAAPKSSSWAKDGCRFGLYQRRSHDVLDIPNCRVHHPNINRAVELLEKATDRVGIAAYTKDSREGGLRYVQLTVERLTGKVCLTLVWAASDIKYTQPALSRLTKELTRLDPDLWHSMWLHCNDGPGNNIFTRNTKNWHKISGNEFLREPMAVGDQGYLFFSPLAFRQGNLDGFDVLANDVARAIPSGSKVCELYAGVGLLGITALTYHAKYGTEPLTWVRCSDENPANPRCFHRSVNTL